MDNHARAVIRVVRRLSPLSFHNAGACGQRLQARLQKIGLCPAGFTWVKVGGGYRCTGGSHFVTDAQLGAAAGQ